MLDSPMRGAPIIEPTALTLSETRYLHGPLVQPRLTGWDFPEPLRALVPLARWLQIIRGRVHDEERELASEEEALGYLSCVSLEAPLSHDWAAIFFYLGQQVLPRWGLIASESFPVVLGFDRPIALNQLQSADLRRFRRWLRHQVEAGTKRQRAGHTKL